jgi:hypothetical protein
VVFEAVFNLMTAPMVFILGLLPDFTAPSTSGFVDAAQWVGGVTALANGWLNFGVLFAGMGIMLAARVGILAVDVAMWIYERIPFI